ncbi:hypothetical protein KUCAC02_028893 [Chaenocephalus aceratus]|uniref:Uncharacterized protein n=1 Tax=Chaenocephalus aceratus TaxID=36190 RepID=A0ACB9X364_CHAAC|nr:hypothetical protein KUCAC02_028893 [Chaenocephalus aceratus]
MQESIHTVCKYVNQLLPGCLLSYLRGSLEAQRDRGARRRRGEREDFNVNMCACSLASLGARRETEERRMLNVFCSGI